MGLAQLERFDEFRARKDRFREIYEESFRGSETIRLQRAPKNARPLWWLPSVVVDLERCGKTVPEIQAILREQEAALTAQDVIEQLGSAVDLILDGGTAASPVVSTVLDVTVTPPRLLRAGKLSQPAIEAVL